MLEPPSVEAMKTSKFNWVRLRCHCLGGSEDEIVFERVLGGFIDAAPVGEEEFPIFLGFVGTQKVARDDHR
jgi:hypothetical protein